MRDWLANIRETKGFTQKEVAVNCDISRSFYADIERGARNPKPTTAKELGAFLGFDWTLFYEQNGRKTRQQNKKTA
jgi:putative transcriptional regulator